MAAARDRPAGGGVLAAACVSALVVNANTSAVTILLPSISKDVDAPVAQLQWAVTGYSLVGAAVIVTSGALGDVLGRRKVFLGGLALFIASCVLIALSTERRRRGRRADDPGRVGRDDPRLRHEPAVGRRVRRRADEGDHAVGRGVRGRRRARAAASAACSSTPPAGRACSGSTPAIAAACIPLTLRTVAGVARPEPLALDRLGRHGAGRARRSAPVILALSEGNDWGWTSAATLGCFAVAIVSRHRCSSGSSGASRRRSSTSSCCATASSSARRWRS